MAYDKSGIMKHAWALFNNDDIALGDMAHLSFEDVRTGVKTFALCLKEAWATEKEIVENRLKEEKEAPFTEEVKAWNWACKKLGVAFDMTDVEKLHDVNDMYKEVWPGTSVWSVAMKAVKLHMKLFA